MKTKLSLVLLASYLLFASAVQATEPLDVVINEIAWMGTEVSYNDEWIELYNNTDSSINLEGWTLKATDGSPKINLTGSVPVGGFYLLERTGDDTVPGIAADYVYTGALKNSGENLELYDSLGNLIDSVNCISGWFAGDNKTKQTMERKNSLLTSDVNNWGTSQNPGGTPKTENSVVATLLPTAPEPELEPQPEESEELSEVAPPTTTSTTTEKAITTPTKIQTITYPSGVVINEILPSPTGPDAEEEWIEIFNQNNFEVDISGWQITDTVGAINNYTFPEETIINPESFLILSRPITKITLNNSGDSLKLLQPNENISDMVVYTKAPRGESFNRIESGWDWSTNLTPGSANILPATAPKLEEKTPEDSPPKTTKTSNSPMVFFVASLLAIFSGAIILILKNNIKKGYNKNMPR